ncbi:MAG: BON domain-containing protein [Halanaerobiaceae bacterium]
MGIFSRGYDDDAISQAARNVIKQDPVVKLSGIQVVAEDGVLELMGKVRAERYKQKIINKIEDKLAKEGIKYEQIKNNLST